MQKCTPTHADTHVQTHQQAQKPVNTLRTHWDKQPMSSNLYYALQRCKALLHKSRRLEDKRKWELSWALKVVTLTLVFNTERINRNSSRALGKAKYTVQLSLNQKTTLLPVGVFIDQRKSVWGFNHFTIMKGKYIPKSTFTMLVLMLLQTHSTRVHCCWVKTCNYPYNIVSVVRRFH